MTVLTLASFVLLLVTPFVRSQETGTTAPVLASALFFLAQMPSVRSIGPGSDNDLGFCSDSVSERFLSDAGAKANTAGHVLHMSPDGDILRTEVVAAVAAALKGESGFEVLEKKGEGGDLHVLNKDLMHYDNIVTSNTDAAFTLRNAFDKSAPDVDYEVSCPKLSTMCQVKVISTGSSSFGQCLMKEDHPISEACLENKYEVALIAIEGPHFLLGASNPNIDCPNIAFDSTGGEFDSRKGRAQFSTEDTTGVAVHHVGFASLRAILEADKQAKAVNPTSLSFDLYTNNCVHYAIDIWRRLGMTESASLAEFVIENIIKDPNVDQLAAQFERNTGGMGGLRYLAARVIGGPSLFREKVEETVYSQFIL